MTSAWTALLPHSRQRRRVPFNFISSHRSTLHLSASLPVFALKSLRHDVLPTRQGHREKAAAMIAHPKGREKALERFGWTGRRGRAFGLQPSAQPLGQVVLLGSHVRTALLSDATGPRSWDPAPSGSPCPGAAPLGLPPVRRRRHLPGSVPCRARHAGAGSRG